MMVRGLISPKGEIFAYIQGSDLFTLDHEQSGRVEGEFIVNLAGSPVWRLIGDGVYSLDRQETIGFLSTPRPEWTD